MLLLQIIQALHCVVSCLVRLRNMFWLEDYHTIRQIGQVC